MWFVYILLCADDSFYIGETYDIAQRLVKHNEGSASAYTAARRPVHLVYAERHATRDDALCRERQLKGWTRAKKQALVSRDPESLKRL